MNNQDKAVHAAYMRQYRKTHPEYEKRTKSQQGKRMRELHPEKYNAKRRAKAARNSETVRLAIEHEANARLIAAAPDLLESLEIIVSLRDTEYKDVGQFNTAIDNARFAIKKARGGSE